MQKSDKELADADYAALATFRHAVRRFQAFSEAQAADVGLTPQQHQALLAIRGAGAEEATVGLVAERLILKSHSASGLANRLEMLGLIIRQASANDRRRTLLSLTPKAHRILGQLSAVHREEINRLQPLFSEIFNQLSHSGLHQDGDLEAEGY